MPHWCSKWPHTHWSRQWNTLYKAHLNSKLWSFNWQLFCRSLPTNELCKHRYGAGPGVCKHCTHTPDSIEHLFLYCPSLSKKVNQVIGRLWSEWTDEILTFTPVRWLLKRQITQYKDLFYILASCTQWNIWKQYSAFLMEDKPTSIGLTISSSLASFKNEIIAIWMRKSTLARSNPKTQRKFKKLYLIGSTLGAIDSKGNLKLYI